MLAASAWWLGPLVVLGRWSPPFLDWIERSADVVREIDLLDVARGTTHWLGFVVTSGGEWWPAGYAVATGPLLVVDTALLAGVSLAGLALRGLPERRFLLVTLAVGVFVLAIAHEGPVSSPLAPAAQALLDGPLVAFRNVHKADPLVRLPLAVGLALAVERLATRPRRPPPRPCASRRGGRRHRPARGGLARPLRGDRPPRHLPRHGAAVASRPGYGSPSTPKGAGRSSFRPRASASTTGAAPSTSRSARCPPPTTPCGMPCPSPRPARSGCSMPSSSACRPAATWVRAVDVLRRLGVRHLVLRNDLDTASAGQPSVTYARSAIRSTPGIALARGFGMTAHRRQR